MTVYFTSDTHFGDPRVLRIDRRPFPSVAEHDEALVALWNETVRPEDEVWHLGDFALGPPPEAVAALLGRLNGRKHLISGNNDGPGTLAAPGWESVQAYAELRIEGRHLILCHYPFRTWNQIGRGSVNLHGHSHGRLTPATRQYDVGVDVQELRPATLDRIIARKRRRKPFAEKKEPGGV
ncbi:metallophosphoesterase family protein [Inquilinus sp. NPDC058860]|uniref:metallophosphoesterase family protein n=1 Tax=Inquilinus sp. NPDC058860 TaxID=3346652 RepID=UPI00369DB61C